MTGFSFLAAALIAAFFLPAASASASEEVRVMVDALVLDQEGNPVPGLTAADFDLTFDGRKQAFSDFRAVGPEAASEPRRFIIIVNRRGAEAMRVRRARAALRKFASEQLSDGDEAMLVGIGPAVEVLQQFALGVDRLRDSLDELSPLPPRPGAQPTGARRVSIASSRKSVSETDSGTNSPGYPQTRASPEAGSGPWMYASGGGMTSR